MIVVNASYKLAPWADVLYAADHNFWRVYMPDIRRVKFGGEMWSVSEQAQQQFGTYWIRHGRQQGYSDEPDVINGGGNSGYQAIHLAAKFGAQRITLLGFDMQRTHGREHWHGKHDGKLANGTGFAAWIRAMRSLADDLAERGVVVVNASRTTALHCFQEQTLEDVLAYG